MNQAQTLIDLEKFMSSVCRRDYHWEDFASDYDQWLDDARAIYDEELEYSPLIQAYFDLMPERFDWEDQDIFEDDQAFRSFQRHLKYQQQYFIEDLANQSDDYHNHLDDYFASLVDRHRKLLLVRVDLSYRFERLATTSGSYLVVSKTRIRYLKIKLAMPIDWNRVARAKAIIVIYW